MMTSSFSKVLNLPKNLAFLTSSRGVSSSIKVTLIGANGGIGQPLGLLLKKNTSIAHLALYDIVGTPGVAADLSHINTPAKVTAHLGPGQLVEALEGADIVVVPAGMPRKPGMERDDLFKANAVIVRDVAEASAKTCPKAFLGIITNPVNSTLPIASEVYKNNDCYDPKKLFGITLLDVTFVSELKNLDVNKMVVPVVGGHSGVTIVPLLSQCQPKAKFSENELKALTGRIQEAGTEVVKAKAGAGSATLSMALAAEYFVAALIKALKGQKNVQCAYVKSDLVKEVEYFASPVELGPNGVIDKIANGVKKCSLLSSPRFIPSTEKCAQINKVKEADPEAVLADAESFLAVGDTRWACEKVWSAASLAIKQFARKMNPPVIVAHHRQIILFNRWMFKIFSDSPAEASSLFSQWNTHIRGAHAYGFYENDFDKYAVTNSIKFARTYIDLVAKQDPAKYRKDDLLKWCDSIYEKF